MHNSTSERIPVFSLPSILPGRAWERQHLSGVHDPCFCCDVLLIAGQSSRLLQPPHGHLSRRNTPAGGRRQTTSFQLRICAKRKMRALWPCHFWRPSCISRRCARTWCPGRASSSGCAWAAPGPLPDSGLRPSWFGQDYPAQRMDLPSPGSSGLVLPRSGGQRTGPLLAVPDCRPADDRRWPGLLCPADAPGATGSFHAACSDQLAQQHRRATSSDCACSGRFPPHLCPDDPGWADLSAGASAPATAWTPRATSWTKRLTCAARSASRRR